MSADELITIEEASASSHANVERNDEPEDGRWYTVHENGVPGREVESDADEDIELDGSDPDEPEMVTRRPSKAPWLGCVVQVGTNFVKIEGVGGASWRLHFDHFWAHCVHEPSPDALRIARDEAGLAMMELGNAKRHHGHEDADSWHVLGIRLDGRDYRNGLAEIAASLRTHAQPDASAIDRARSMIEGDE